MTAPVAVAEDRVRTSRGSPSAPQWMQNGHLAAATRPCQSPHSEGTSALRGKRRVRVSGGEVESPANNDRGRRGQLCFKEKITVTGLKLTDGRRQDDPLYPGPRPGGGAGLRRAGGGTRGPCVPAAAASSRTIVFTWLRWPLGKLRGGANSRPQPHSSCRFGAGLKIRQRAGRARFRGRVPASRVPTTRCTAVVSFSNVSWRTSTRAASGPRWPPEKVCAHGGRWPTQERGKRRGVRSVGTAAVPSSPRGLLPSLTAVLNTVSGAKTLTTSSRFS